MQQVKNFFLSLLFFIVFSVIGIVFGFGVGYFVTNLNNEGLFTSWKQLDGSQRFKNLVDVSFQKIWAQTSDEKLYAWEFYCDHGPHCNQWIEVKDLPDDTNNAFEQPVIKSDLCKITTFQFFREVPGHSIECAQIEFYGMENKTNASFALLDDGTVWLWIFTGSMIVNLIVPAIFSFAGFVIGIMLFSFFMLRRRNNKTQSVETGNS
jgi:hypothetical protein